MEEDRVLDLMDELWVLVEEHQAEGPAPVLRALAERIAKLERTLDEIRNNSSNPDMVCYLAGEALKKSRRPMESAST